jgi:nicotinamide riboside kinase
VAGPPQSGKTALAMALAQKFRMWPGAWQLTAVSPSYAPMFAAEKAEQGRTDWSQDDCLHAAAMQLAMDGEAASDSAPLLLCDSSLPTIAAHYQHRWGCSNPHLETLLSDFPPALLLITRPYENPGADAWLIPRLEDLAQQSGIATQVLSGAPPERFDKAWRDLQQLVAQSWQF